MDKKGVSVMISTIVLIAIIFAISVIMIAALTSAGAPEPPFGGALAIENLKEGYSEVVLKHIFGETMDHAFDYNTHPLENDNWRNLEIRLNGIRLDNNCIGRVCSAGSMLTDNTRAVKFRAGDRIWINLYTKDNLRTLAIGDKLMLIYRGRPQPIILAEFEVEV